MDLGVNSGLLRMRMVLEDFSSLISFKRPDLPLSPMFVSLQVLISNPVQSWPQKSESFSHFCEFHQLFDYLRSCLSQVPRVPTPKYSRIITTVPSRASQDCQKRSCDYIEVQSGDQDQMESIHKYIVALTKNF